MWRLLKGHRGITMLTLAATFLHAWLGCCCHHLHEAPTELSGVTATQGRPGELGADPHALPLYCAAGSARHQHAGECPEGTDDSGKTPGPRCHEQTCKYVSAPTAKLVHAAQDSRYLPAEDEIGLNANLHRLLSHRAPNLSSAVCSPAVRLHQATQVWRV